jgi:hypothetical protein
MITLNEYGVVNLKGKNLYKIFGQKAKLINSGSPIPYIFKFTSTLTRGKVLFLYLGVEKFSAGLSADDSG